MNSYVLVVLNIFAFLAIFEVVYSLTCLPCSEARCTDERRLFCRGGMTKGPCGCCNVCAKVEGEKCGGPWNIAGVCDKGLVCEPKSNVRPGVCRSRHINKKVPLPRCSIRSGFSHFRNTGYWFKRRMRGCRNIRTTFCTKSCRRCCVHSTTCNPDVFKYTRKTSCQYQHQLYVPRNLFSNDQPDENEAELDTLERDIKG